MSRIFTGDWLVDGGSGGSSRTATTATATAMATSTSLEEDNSDTNQHIYPVLYSNVSLSFWGGIDPLTGIIIDHTHPLHNQCVTNTILVLPSGRGSCTASQVLLELILNRKAPHCIVLRDRDGLVCVGSIIAQSMFEDATACDIVQVMNDGEYDNLLQCQPQFGSIVRNSNNGDGNASIIVGTTRQQVEDRRSELLQKQESSKKSTISTSPQPQYTQEEQEMFDNAKSEAERRAIQCLIQYANIVTTTTKKNGDGTTTKPYNTTSSKKKYIDVDMGHIDGVTYIGQGGLSFVQQLNAEGGQVKIPTTLNSCSTDLRYWKQLGIIPTVGQQNSIQLAQEYIQLGCNENSLTCAPYLLDTNTCSNENGNKTSTSAIPTLGQHIIWGESNAVVYANSVLGARTEKYADYLDICCSIVGKVPNVGVHLSANRIPTVVIDVSNIHISIDNDDNDDDDDDDTMDKFGLFFPVLGHLCGRLSDGQVPIVIGLESLAKHVTKDHMKSFCAAFGTTGASPLVHVSGITPESNDPLVVKEWIQSCSKTCVVTANQLDDTFALLDQQHLMRQQRDDDPVGNVEYERIDWIALGNPHLSLSECDTLLKLVQSLPQEDKATNNSKPPKKLDSVQIIACMSRVLYDQSPAIPALREFGMEFVRDTCWCMLLDPPMIPLPGSNSTILTNSGKYAHYGPGLTGHKFRLGTMKDCIQAAMTGTLPRTRTASANISIRRLPWSAKTTNQATIRSYSSSSTPTTPNPFWQQQQQKQQQQQQQQQQQHSLLPNSYVSAAVARERQQRLLQPHWYGQLQQSKIVIRQVLKRLRR